MSGARAEAESLRELRGFEETTLRRVLRDSRPPSALALTPLCVEMPDCGRGRAQVRHGQYDETNKEDWRLACGVRGHVGVLSRTLALGLRFFRNTFIPLSSARILSGAG